MSNDLITKTFNGQSVRVVKINGEPWFVARDVCAILNLSYNVPGRVLGQGEKELHPVYTPGGLQQMLIISESGLYKLIMRSDKPQARQFQNWVTKDVLPAIRKDGAYVMGEEKVVVVPGGY